MFPLSDHFEPRNLQVEVGDLVVFEWKNKHDKITIAQTEDGLQNSTMDGGFYDHKPPAHEGN